MYIYMYVCMHMYDENVLILTCVPCIPMKETSRMDRSNSAPTELEWNDSHWLNSVSLQYNLIVRCRACAIAYTASTVTKKSRENEREKKTHTNIQKNIPKEIWVMSRCINLFCIAVVFIIFVFVFVFGGNVCMWVNFYFPIDYKKKTKKYDVNLLRFRSFANVHYTGKLHSFPS